VGQARFFKGLSMSSATEETKALLGELTKALRDLHKQLVAVAKSDYQAESGSEISASQLLQLLTRHPQFNWLHQLSEFMVDIDALLDEPVTADADVQEIFSQAKSLIIPQHGNESDFSAHYIALLAQHPAVTMAHANVRRILSAS
jgi:hypothetical protein